MGKAIRHGTNTGYTYHKCRCDDCKSAHAAKGKAWRESNPDYYPKYRQENSERESERRKRWLEANPGYRQRSWQENRERDSAKNREWREANPDYRRRYYEANREKAAEDLRVWRESNREQYEETTRRWREANPDYNRIYRAANPDKNREWQEANPERLAELRRRAAARRRARKRDAFVEDVPRLEIFERDNWECTIPGCFYPGVPASLDVEWPSPLFASIDHVIPLSKGGLHERSNLACAHLRCNVAKRDRLEGIA